MATKIINNGHAVTVVTPKGTAQWAQVLKANQYGKFEITLHLDDAAAAELESKIQPALDAGIKDVKDAGKTDFNIAPLSKGIDEETGLHIFKFKQDELKRDGTANFVSIVDVNGKTQKDWDKLIGNGSQVKCKVWFNPYYMATTKTVGLSMKLNAVQVIDLVEYSGGDNSFGDETGGDDTPTTSDDF